MAGPRRTPPSTGPVWRFSLIPRSSRFKVTLLTGLVASVSAVFPIVTMKLLDFVALWGMILMPMGAVIFVDFWILLKLGLRSNFAEATGRSVNWAAGAQQFSF